MKLRLLAMLFAIGMVASANACGDPTAIDAQFDNNDSKDMTIFALNGTLPSLPAAMNVFLGVSARVDASFNFDLAFDLDANGQVLVYPVRAVAAEFVPVHRVGLAQSDRSFDASVTAPTGGYRYDSVTVAPVGKTFYVDVVNSANCSVFSLLGQNIRGKFMVDSVNVGSRRIFVHLLSNPNCGFRSLVPGRPKD
jgi:hypothetical protein